MSKHQTRADAIRAATKRIKQKLADNPNHHNAEAYRARLAEYAKTQLQADLAAESERVGNAKVTVSKAGDVNISVPPAKVAVTGAPVGKEG